MDDWFDSFVGPTFMYATGNAQHLYISDPDLVKEISLCKSLDLGKPLYLIEEHGPLLGLGVTRSNGNIWAHQRKIIAPEFFMDKVKGMVGIMVESALPVTRSWENPVDQSEGGVADIRVDEDLRNFTADVISKACFGSSYSKGKEIFKLLRALQECLFRTSLLIRIPALRCGLLLKALKVPYGYLPTKNHRETWRLEKEIQKLILKLVMERKEESARTCEKDLLQMILDGAYADQLGKETATRFVVDNCKNIYVAGHETLAAVVTWTLMLLASHPEWQSRSRSRARKELSMVIQEALRLYPPTSLAFEEMKFGNLYIPKGINLWIPISILHRIPEIWGADANEFKPERFAHGIFGACKHPQAYIPFGIGPRNCLGHKFALIGYRASMWVESPCKEGMIDDYLYVYLCTCLRSIQKMISCKGRDEEMEVIIVEMFWSLALLAFGSFFVYLYSILLLKPKRLREKLRRQGITGPPPSFLYGNLPEMRKIQSSVTKAPNDHEAEILEHDYTSTLFPYFEQWRKEYGSVYTYSTGNRQHLYVNNPDLVKEMNLCLSLDLGKPTYVTKTLAPILGNGIVRSNGQDWARQRKIVAPEFFMDKVKGMVGLMLESALPMLETWEKRIEGEGGIADMRIDEDLRSLSADVISRACFGSCYSKGKQIFSKLRALQKTISTKGFLFGFPNFRLVPTKKNREIWRLEREIESLILEEVKKREEECMGTTTTTTTTTTSSEKDLLELILEGAANDQLGTGSSKRLIVDNCKNIYFAGHEATATAATWCLMILASYPEWQARLRAEVLHVCGDRLPDADALRKMKTVTMVIQETLRLYPPAAFVSREVFEDTKIGDVVVPKGICLWTLIPALHRDSNLWGPDANKFKPERFANGISEACKLPQAYLPFGLGPRVCLGRNFAMVQLKIIISLLVSKFTFSLSPKYRHSPAYLMLVEPAHGVHLLIKSI
ncbi:hypothetical protein HHK36_033361 [Tetracentron sinense]|uniref:Cytochrome P450 n=1 Tax=Tetracentron sinense TaxID=13715 RepID=A0A835CWS1_TETSI|nr:hypothetical protein HHK36_033361 [Tetracentron sinense]